MFSDSRDDILTAGGIPLLGITPAIFKHRHTIHDYFASFCDQFDKMTGTGVGIGIPRAILTTDPRNVDHILRLKFENYIKGPIVDDAAGDLLGHGIFNADGEVWRYQRKTASHIFNIKNFRDNFTTVSLRNLKSMSTDVIDVAAQTKLPLDLHSAIHKYTLDSFLEFSFGISLEDMTDEDKAKFTTSFDACQRNVIQRILNPAYRVTESLEGWLMPWKTSMKQHLDIVDKFSFGVVEQRRLELANGGEYTDLLSRFMGTKNHKDQPLCDKELRDVVLNFVGAGRDTTAQSICWTLYELFLNPGVKYKLLAEIKETITDEMETDAAEMYEAVKRMKYANAVFREALRLHPPVPFNAKVALQDDVWPDGTQIKKNDYIVLTLFGQGRSQDLWGEDAKEFKPERWFTKEGTLRSESPSKWNIFNAGPRTCIGQVLATTVALVTISSLLRRYDFKLAPDQEITYQVAMTLPMKNGMKVYVKQRK
ncbi:hypothetical protein [Absidia glauca]|uniref:Cytochrome P450 n=1 Tax=Absidia glauca TaxID=4829 RepID=A0A163IRN9_ABSGL|nr:hypothetical protein [Absidia glauca]